jgi:PAS domain S-box-containing protein
MSRAGGGSLRALVLAPHGRDAQVAQAILREASIESVACRDLPALIDELDAGVGVALIVEDVLHEQDYGPLVRWLEAQPPWSDLPILVLAQRGPGLERNPAAARFSQALGNVTFLERPFHPTTLVSMVQTALRGRRRQYEARERIEHVRSAEERFRTLADNIPTLCWMADEEGEVFWFNLRWYEYTGGSPEEHLGGGWMSAHDPAVLPQVLERWTSAVASGEPVEMTFPLKSADGVFRPFLTRVVPLRDETGRIVRWFGAHTDVSQQQQDEEHLRLMVNELNHRVKNTLATVQSIVVQTLRGEPVSDRLRETLTSRIMALSKAHDVLTDEQWAGADLREIAVQTAAPYRTPSGEERFVLHGPPVRLPPKTAIAVALAFHELATNAAKYGALSDGGVVDLSWSVRPASDGRELRIVWRERGGPPVTPPSRSGFGTRLIERSLAADLRGRVVLEYPREGAVCTIEASLPGTGNEPEAAAAKPFHGRRREERRDAADPRPSLN